MRLRVACTDSNVVLFLDPGIFILQLKTIHYFEVSKYTCSNSLTSFSKTIITFTFNIHFLQSLIMCKL